ncbi:MAG: hypothetical protein JW902_16235 [Syntrophaceae bacterium]|nr:hypothetical protein [Syntrophaceae bacterium]
MDIPVGAFGGFQGAHVYVHLVETFLGGVLNSKLTGARYSASCAFVGSARAI